MATTAPKAALTTERRRRLGTLLRVLTIVLAVLDMNVVSAAVVPIVKDLDPVHGVDRLPWLVSAFALAATTLLPLYGKLCDLHGAKLVLVLALRLPRPAAELPAEPRQALAA